MIRVVRAGRIFSPSCVKVGRSLNIVRLGSIDSKSGSILLRATSARNNNLPKIVPDRGDTRRKKFEATRSRNSSPWGKIVTVHGDSCIGGMYSLETSKARPSSLFSFAKSLASPLIRASLEITKEGVIETRVPGHDPIPSGTTQPGTRRSGSRSRFAWSEQVLCMNKR